MSNLFKANFTVKKGVLAWIAIGSLVLQLVSPAVFNFPVPPVAQAADTGYLNPSSDAADTGGDGNGFEIDPTNAYTNGSGNATNNNGAGDRHRFYDYGISTPANVVVNGIEVRLDWWLDSTSGNNSQSAQLSWDGGANWTASKSTTTETTIEATSVLGGASDTWGRSWTASELSNANFRVRLISNGNSSRDFFLDWVAVKLHYTEIEPNPALALSCGLDVGLVVDISGSIDSGEMTQIKNALASFADAFTGTPTVFSLTRFNSTATVSNNFSMDPAQAVTAVGSLPSAGSGFTNWDDGLAKAYGTFDPRPAKPNLIVIATDGNPNRWGNPAVNDGAAVALAKAVELANTIKGAGTRILAVGIGSDLNTSNLTAITGPNVAPPATIDENADVVTADFDTLGTAMSNLAKGLCGGKILVQKQIDTDGDGQADITGNEADPLLAGYTFDVTGSPSDPAAQTTTNTGSLEFADVLEGTYSLIETSLPAGTALSSALCVKGDTPVGAFDLNTKTVSGLSMAAEDTISCTFVNSSLVENTAPLCQDSIDNDEDGLVDLDDPDCEPFIPQLTVIKHVITDNGGDAVAADFTMNVTGTNVSQSSFAGSESGVTVTLDPGSYGVSEGAVSGYGMSASSDCEGSIAVGDQKTCTITNDDIAPTITLIKQPINDNGGTALPGDFTMQVGSTQVHSGDTTPVDANIPIEIVELSLTGYNFVSITGDGQCPTELGGTVTLNEGENITCTITNDDQPGKLIVTKQVINQEGGQLQASPADFTMSVEGTNASPNSFPGSDSGTEVTLDAGSYSVSETGPEQYTASYSEACSGTIGLGETKECLVINTSFEVTMSRIIVDKVTNPESSQQSFNFSLTGEAFEQLFSLMDLDTPWDSGFINPGSYALSESEVAGWQQTGASCSNNSSISNIAVSSGQTVVCTVTNTAMGKIIVEKVTDPSNSEQTFNFSASYNQDGFTLGNSGQNDSGYLEPGTYSVAESVPEGWTQTSATCDDGSDPAEIELSAGEIVTCTFTNTQYGSITVAKQTNPSETEQTFSFDASYYEGSFSLGSGGSNDSGFLAPGTYSVSELELPAGWSLTSATCDDDSDPEEINLAAGETVTCTFTNTKGAPPQLCSISGQKFNDLNNNGAKDSGEPGLAGWTIYLDLDDSGTLNGEEPSTTTDSSGNYSFADLSNGSYIVREVLQSGWTQTMPAGDGSYSVGIEGNNVTGKDFGNHQQGELMCKGSGTYTLDADFDKGSLINVTHSPSNQLQLSEAVSTFDFMWVAVSTKGTAVKINTDTGAIVGEYRTTPSSHGNGDPSRTTVDKDGSVWLTNRSDVFDGVGSVVHIGLVENNQCEDRNNNGVIDTSTAQDDIKAWTDASGDRNVGTAADECIVHYVKLPNASGTRHVSVNTNNDVWVAGLYSRNFDLIKGGKWNVPNSGTIIRSEPSVGYGGYGGLIDSIGVIWSARSLLRWDTANPLTGPNGGNWTGYDHDSYGLCIDSQNNVWNTSLFGNQIRKFAPNGTLLGTFGHGSSTAQGCVVDQNDHIWVAHSLLGGDSVGHILNDGTFIGNVTVGSGPTGVAVDSNGKIWATNYNSGTVSRINPAAGPLGADSVTPVGAVDFTTVYLGGNPYNYSDMTGSTLSGMAESGTWTVVHDGEVGGFPWKNVTWNADVPSGASLSVTVATSSDGVTFGAPQTVTSGQDLSSLTDRYLKLVVSFARSESGASPVLFDLTVNRDCGDTPPPVTPPGGGGGGGGGSPTFYLHTEQIGGSSTDSVTVTWFTSLPGTSRVVYDTASHPIIGSDQNFSYASSTPEDSILTTFHSMIISGLTLGTNYWFRPSSTHGSTTLVGIELVALTLTGTVAGVQTEAPTPPPSGGSGEEPSGPPPSTASSGATGEVAGVETESLAQALEPSAEPVVEPVTEPVAPTASGNSCVTWIWILLVANIIVSAYLWNRDRQQASTWRRAWWWLTLVLAVLPVLIWYPACGLWIWLLVLLVVALLLAAFSKQGQSANKGNS